MSKRATIKYMTQNMKYVFMFWMFLEILLRRMKKTVTLIRTDKIVYGGRDEIVS